MERRTETRRSDDVNREVQDAMTLRDIKDLCEEMAILRAEVAKLKGDRDKALIWGILMLGTAVVSMATWIFKVIIGRGGT